MVVGCQSSPIGLMQPLYTPTRNCCSISKLDFCLHSVLFIHHRPGADSTLLPAFLSNDSPFLLTPLLITILAGKARVIRNPPRHPHPRPPGRPNPLQNPPRCFRHLHPLQPRHLPHQLPLLRQPRSSPHGHPTTRRRYVLIQCVSSAFVLRFEDFFPIDGDVWCYFGSNQMFFRT